MPGQSLLERQDSLMDEGERQDSFERYDSDGMELSSPNKYEPEKLRASMDRYEQEKLLREQSIFETDDLMADEPHDNSLIEPYQPQQSAPSPVKPVDADLAEKQQADKGKSVSFEEDEKPPPERKIMSAKERWHWAYNRIIHQLNVSTETFGFFFCCCKNRASTRFYITSSCFSVFKSLRTRYMRLGGV
jgi:hypothetical protein